MARGVNKVILLGNVGKDPETRAMPSGGSVANLSLATSESWKDKDTGEKKEKTEWHHLVCFGKGADILAQYVRKGSQLYVEGKLRTRKWTDKNGAERYTTEVVVDEFQLLGGKPENRTQPPAAAPVAAGGGGGATERGFEDDDIPFITRLSDW